MTTHPLVRKLQHGACLSEGDQKVLAELALGHRAVAARGTIAEEGDEARFLPLVVDGWACRYRVLENGKRQILSLLLPGDLCEPYGVFPRLTESALAALTPVTLARIPLGAIRQAVQLSPAIEEALWWDLHVASAIDREHIVSLGRRSAVERLGHLFCELHLRLAMVGLADRAGFDLPVTQNDLADLLGVSAVHVNRSLQELRATGLVSLRSRRVTIHDVDGLRAASLFDPGYLHARVAQHSEQKPPPAVRCHT